MTQERKLLIDFENVQKIDWSQLADDFRVIVFVGASQKSIPLKLVQGAQRLGAQVDWVQVEGTGSNALDFYIVYYLGCEFTRFPKAQYIILSNDTGFDPLLRHLKRKGFCCRRISALAELETHEADVPESNYKRVLDLLSKTQARPKTRATLLNHIASLFKKQLPQSEVENLLTQLLAEGKVSEENNTLIYHF